jgi:hypothetical protein
MGREVELKHQHPPLPSRRMIFDFTPLPDWTAGRLEEFEHNATLWLAAMLGEEDNPELWSVRFEDGEH